MTDHLGQLLEHLGYGERAAQRRLYEALISGEPVVAQAGTGVGKSIAILAAAVNRYVATGRQSLIVTPTRVLMDQYMERDAPATAACFGIDVAELRGKAHYYCQRSDERIGTVYERGCLGKDVGCSMSKWQEDGYDCRYQAAKERASLAQVVVTNTDMWLVNDTILVELGAEVFDPDGSLFVDEAHQLEDKIRDYAARSLNAKRLENFRRVHPENAAARKLAAAIAKAPDGILLSAVRGFPGNLLLELSRLVADKTWKERDEEILEAMQRIVRVIENGTPNAVIWIEEDSIKLSWASIAESAGRTLSARPFALVSATTPRSMRGALGIPDAQFLDVGHPFDYGRQSTISISEHGGSFAAAKVPGNFEARAEEVYQAILARDGGALVLFSAFSDLERVHDLLAPRLRAEGRLVLRQGDQDMPNDVLAEKFKADGRAVLFGAASFATGFDCPGPALSTVVLFKLPYPGRNPLTATIADQNFRRYEDMMRTVAVQSIGRLVRTTDDIGHVYIADSRASRLLDTSDPMTRHLAEMRRV